MAQVVKVNITKVNRQKSWFLYFSSLDRLDEEDLIISLDFNSTASKMSMSIQHWYVKVSRLKSWTCNIVP